MSSNGMFPLPASPDPSDEPPHQEEEFVSLITRNQRVILGFLMTLVPGSNDAEDILQRTNLVLWRKRDQFQIGTNFKAWAFAIARWEALAFFKESKRHSWLVFNDELTELVAAQMAVIPEKQLDTMPEALGHCLGKLSQTHREMILERYSRGQRLRECSKIFNRSESSLKVTLHRLRTTLRRCISQYSNRHHL